MTHSPVHPLRFQVFSAGFAALRGGPLDLHAPIGTEIEFERRANEVVESYVAIISNSGRTHLYSDAHFAVHFRILYEQSATRDSLGDAD